MKTSSLVLALLVGYAMAKDVEEDIMLQYCYDIGEPVSSAFSSGGMRYYDYPSPETLPLQEIQKNLEERKEIFREYALNEAVVNDALLTLFVDEGLDEEATPILLDLLECLEYNQDADFTIVLLVRIMFTTSVYDELILPYLEKIPLWITKEEKLRVYWTENHMFMYTTNSYLLRQKFPERFPALNDPTLDNRLSWMLKSKTENGFFEFNSHLYMGFTLNALLNLYDFSTDTEIKRLAHDCLTRFLKDWVEVTNSFGVNAVASSRTYQLMYFTGERPSNNSRIYGYANQEAMSLITGLGPLIVEGKVFSSTMSLLMSDFDLAPIAASYTPELYVTKSSGTSYKDGIDFLFKNLSREDRLIAQLSMGGYVNQEYILDFLDFGRTYDLWDHGGFAPSKFMKSLPKVVVKTLAGAISSVAAGSVLYVPEFKLYKNHEIMLSSINNYFPGKKVYQQFPSSAVIGDAAVFTQSMAADIWNTSGVKDQTKTNNQMPLLVQDHNLLVAIYNPNLDLSVIGSPNLEVGLHFDYRNFDELIDGRDIDQAEDKWVFGRLGEGYIAVYRHCINDKHDFKVCFDHKQVWITLIGNNRTHDSFPEFMNEVIDNSELEYSIDSKCVSAKGVIDGKAFDEKFCRELGGFYILLIWVIFYFVFQATCCFVCCRKKRRVWKRFVRNSKEAVLKDRKKINIDDKETTGADSQPDKTSEENIVETSKLPHYTS